MSAERLPAALAIMRAGCGATFGTLLTDSEDGHTVTPRNEPRRLAVSDNPSSQGVIAELEDGTALLADHVFMRGMTKSVLIANSTMPIADFAN